MRSRYWRPVLYLFTEHPKLATVFTDRYFDLEQEIISTRKLKTTSKGWSESEKFMLALALHLYNPVHKLPQGLSDMDYLDSTNTELAFHALSLRYRT